MGTSRRIWSLPAIAWSNVTPPIKHCLDRAAAVGPHDCRAGTVRCRRLARRRQRSNIARPAAERHIQRYPDGAVFDLGPLGLARCRHSSTRNGDGDDTALTFAARLRDNVSSTSTSLPTSRKNRRKLRYFVTRWPPRCSSGDPVAALTLAIIASYQPLYSIPGFEALLARPWSGDVDDLLTQQVREPLAERAFRNNIPQLTPIENDVSVAGAEPIRGKPLSALGEVHSGCHHAARRCENTQRFSQRTLSPDRTNRRPRRSDRRLWHRSTGHHDGQALYGARVLAVDLSLSSLCYAKYRTDALGLNNIEYGQADILKIASLRRDFDVIACTGVLHHLADPLEGWRALGSILRPNGIMHIALYSELARADVVTARNFIATRGYKANIDDIRLCRQDILALDETSPERAIAWRGDFYAISDCRDLLFHVQEHRFRLPQIKHFLADNGLAMHRLRALMPMYWSDIARNFRTTPPAPTSIIGTNSSSRTQIHSRACISSSCKSRRSA